MNCVKTFGPYESKKAAMRANCVISMGGDFSQGRFIKVDGTLFVSATVRAYRHGDEWLADVELRAATEAESTQYAEAIAKRDGERQAATAAALKAEY